MIKKLRIKFVIVTMSIASLMLLSIMAVVFFSTGRNLKEDSLRMMKDIADDPRGMKDMHDFKDPGEDRMRLPYFVVETDLYGNFVRLTANSYQLSDLDKVPQVLAACFREGRSEGVLREYGLRYYRVETATGESIVFSDMSSENMTLWHLLETCAIVGGAAFLVFLVLSIFLARWMVHPVERAWDEQRQFVADASHELKTPLTAIITNTDLLEDEELSREERQLYLTNIKNMSKQMKGLTLGLLELARADIKDDTKTFDSVCVSDLVNDVLLSFEPVFFENNRFLEYEIEDEIFVRGNENKLRQLSDILLDNACKYSSENQTSHVFLKRTGHGCILDVASPGQPLSEQEQTDVFRRFYRGDKARSMNHSYGLGLSIAKRVVEEHRGKIYVKSFEGYNHFYVELTTS